MSKDRTFSLLLLSSLMMALLTIGGCQSRAVSAQKLFDQGKYEQVMKRYPDLEISQRARAKLADKLLEEKQYSLIFSQYPDTRAAYQARMDMADQALKEGKYQMLLDSFPGSPAAKTAREKLADSLYKAQKYDELMAKFGDMPQAIEIREKLSQEDLAKAKKMRGDAQKQALEEIMRKYSGAAAYKEASQMLSEINQKAQKKK